MGSSPKKHDRVGWADRQKEPMSTIFSIAHCENSFDRPFFFLVPLTHIKCLRGKRKGKSQLLLGELFIRRVFVSRHPAGALSCLLAELLQLDGL